MLLRSAVACKAAYRQPRARRLIVERTGPGSALVAFRGARSVADLARSLHVALVPLGQGNSDGVRVHAGILRLWRDAVEPELTELLVHRRGWRGEAPVAVTFAGHSAGGALAALAAAHYAPRLASTTCHTFGALRAGDDAFLEWCAARACIDDAHVELARDPVPALLRGWPGYHAAELPGHAVLDSHLGAHAIEAYIQRLQNLRPQTYSRQ